MRLPMVAGSLRGRWWLPASRGKTLRLLGGTYEPEQTRLFDEWVRPGRTPLFLSTHGPSVYCECVAALREMGYDLRPIVGRDVDAASELLCTPVEE